VRTGNRVLVMEGPRVIARATIWARRGSGSSRAAAP
jgi:hypothetical protein